MVGSLKQDRYIASLEDELAELGKGDEAADICATLRSDMGRNAWYRGELSYAYAGALIDSLKRAVERYKAEAKVANPNVTTWEDSGKVRVTFEGTVRSIEWKPSDFGGNYEMTVDLADGRTAKMTRPSKLNRDYDDAVLVGAPVQVTATAAPWARNPTVAYVKRPTVKVLANLITADQREAAEKAWNLLSIVERPYDSVRYTCSHQADSRYHSGEATRYGQRCNGTIQVMSDVWDLCPETLAIPAEADRWSTEIAPQPELSDLVAWHAGLSDAELAYVARFDGRYPPTVGADAYLLRYSKDDTTYYLAH